MIWSVRGKKAAWTIRKKERKKERLRIIRKR